MAIERQQTFKSNVTKPLDEEVNNYLQNNEVDPAMIQVVIDGGNGVKTATLTYGDRELLKKLYEEKGRTYSDSDKVNYVHAKDIILPFTSNLDEAVNAFISDENISVLSISRYFTLANQGAFILYIDLAQQKVKFEEKQKEMAAAQEKMAKELAQQAVKDVDISTTNDTTDKYAEMLTEETHEDTTETTKDEKTEEKITEEETKKEQARANNKKFWRK